MALPVATRASSDAEGPGGADAGGGDEEHHSPPLLVQLGLVSTEDWQGFRRSVRTTVWDNRRAVARWGIWVSEGIAWFRAPGTAQEQLKSESEKEAEKEKEPNALASIAFIAAASAVLLRVGGRAAFLQLLGADALQDSEVQGNITSIIGVWDGLSYATRFVFILGAWITAKVLMLDAVTFPLAVVNGILFNGVLEGTIVSCVCATIGSSVAFFLSRSFLYDKTRSRLDSAPGLRALENAVAGDGAKAVFTLRLAPILPLPIGGYAYVYGITRLRWEEFALGTFAGSAKPYFLDAYLGTLFKGLSQLPTSGDDPVGDAILLVTFVVTLATGTFASDLAVRSFGELQEAVASYGTDIASSRAAAYDDERSKDRLLANQDFKESLVFWGIQADDFPGWISAIVTTVSKAQAQNRAVYAEQWLAYQREVQARPADQGSDLRVNPAEWFQPSAAASGEVSQRWKELRPEYAEAATGWRAQFGLETAQAWLLAPTLFEAIGAYSNPELWPKLLANAKESVAQVRAEKEQRALD